ncbi:hypothetical protein LTS18_011993, partial [Coniosporium uncinatum]
TAPTNRSPNFLPQQGGNMSPSFGPVTQQPQQLRPHQPLRPNFQNFQPQQQQQQQPQQQRHTSAPQRPQMASNYTSSSGVSNASTVASGSTNGQTGNSSVGQQSNYYPSPFQGHMDQLGKYSPFPIHFVSTEQEYDAQAEMVDEQDPSDHSAGPIPPPNYPPQFNQHMSTHGMQMTHQQHPQSTPQQSPMTTQPPTQQFQQPPQHGVPVDQNGATFPAMNQLFDPYDPMLDADPFGLSASMHFPTQFSYEAK